jgi:surfeit locus 1 family protein
MKLNRLISHRWWKTSLLVIAAVIVMIRLGLWQLDRLDQRRAFNARVEEQLAQSALEISEENLRADLYNMEYREAIVLGEYDHDRQVVLRNQDWQGRLGVHLLTPLIVQGSDRAIMVNRGWIPYEDFEAGKLSQFDENGLVEVNGVIRRSQTKPRIGGRADQIPAEGEPPLQAWNWINVGGIAGQLPYELLPVYLQGSPEPSRNQMPYRTQLELDLNEGSHLGYAFQWFTFALILAIGYPIYVSREEKRLSTPTSKGKPYISQNKPRHDAGAEGYKKV